MARALIVVDVQNDFCEGGSMGVSGGAETAYRIGQRLHEWADTPAAERGQVGDYAVVVATQDHHIDPGGHFSDQPNFVDTWPPHCVVGTDGAAFHPNLDPQPFDAIFTKGEYTAAYSGFEGATHHPVSREPIMLADWLRQHEVDTVDICGIATDHCVRATALDAATEGFTTRVLADLTAAVAPDQLSTTYTAFQQAGVSVSGAPVTGGA